MFRFHALNECCLIWSAWIIWAAPDFQHSVLMRFKRLISVPVSKNTLQVRASDVKMHANNNNHQMYQGKSKGIVHPKHRRCNHYVTANSFDIHLQVNKWQNWHFWVNYSFDVHYEGQTMCQYVSAVVLKTLSPFESDKDFHKMKRSFVWK